MLPCGVAVIVEPRKHEALRFSVLSVLEKVSHWCVIIFCGVDNEDWVRKTFTDVEDRVQLRLISPGCKNLSIEEYNCLLTSVHFYRQFKDFEYVLVFQSDSMLFKDSEFSVEDFLGWDYIGAPWQDKPICPGGNGGLSLRRVRTMMNICRRFPFPRNRGVNEDVYFSRKKINFAPRSLSSLFSVESVLLDSRISFGCHKPWSSLHPSDWKKLQTRVPSVSELCDLQRTVLTPPFDKDIFYQPDTQEE